MDLEEVYVNLGICPHCGTPVHFRKTKEESIFACPICLEKSRQYKNGKVLFTKMNLNIKDESIL
jgi:hypothetical protein